MQIAVVSPLLPLPSTTHGRERISRLSQALASAGQVHLFSAVRSQDQAALTGLCGRSFPPYCRVVTSTVPSDATAKGILARAAHPFFGGELRRALLAAHDARSFDAIVLFGSETISSIHGIRRAAVVVDEPKLRSREALLAGRSPLGLVRGLKDWASWGEVQREAWTRADVVTVPTEGDARLVSRVRPDTGQVIPYGVEAREFRFLAPSKRSGLTVLFTGNLSDIETQNRARVLAEQVMPLVERAVPEVTLTIAGSSLSREIRSLERDTIQVVGSLRSLRPLMENHVVYAVPPFPGRIPMSDMLGAMAAGMPLVLPPALLRGSGLREEKHFLAGTTIEMAARNIIHILKHREHFDDMARGARAHAEALDWENIANRFVHLVMATTHHKHG